MSAVIAPETPTLADVSAEPDTRVIDERNSDDSLVWLYWNTRLEQGGVKVLTPAGDCIDLRAADRRSAVEMYRHTFAFIGEQ